MKIVSIFDSVWVRFGLDFGSQKEAKNPPKSDPRRVQNEDDVQEQKKSSSRASWSRLEPILGRLGGHLGVHICAPVHAGVCLVKNHVFDVDKLARRVLDRTWPNLAAKSAENDPNLAPQDDPKSTKNRCQKMIEILIEKKPVLVIHLGRSGGMRWPPGGIIGGAKDSLFEICRYLRHIMALRCTDLGCRSRTLGSAPTGRAAD